MRDRRVYKYKLEITDQQFVKLPEDAEILSVNAQGMDLVLYALVDFPIGQAISRVVRIAGTGHPIIGNVGQYVGTAMMREGQLVWHVFID